MSFYAWVAVVLAVAVTVVVLGWHSSGGTPDPSVRGNGMSPTSAVIDSAILVIREGLGTVLVLAAVTASFLGVNKVCRRPVAAGAGVGLAAILVLLLVVNWFFHRVYWTGWIQHHHRRQRGLLASESETAMRRVLLRIRGGGATRPCAG
ncbi:MAG TPA: hypothetical protein VMG37_22845 [Solirubrobacteraceae bacterium]|nr:hypothetical protein [Solirubrobacteraceae bacterium]